MTTLKHHIYVLWGDDPEGAGQHPRRYEFATEAELRAFTLGISEMDGWMGYHLGDTPGECLRAADIEAEDENEVEP